MMVKNKSQSKLTKSAKIILKKCLALNNPTIYADGKAIMRNGKFLIK